MSEKILNMLKYIVFVILTWCSQQSESKEISYGTEEASVFLDDENLTVRAECRGQPLSIFTKQRNYLESHRHVNFTSVELEDCVPTSTSYAAILTSLYFKVDNIKKLIIQASPKHKLKAIHLKGFSIQYLDISALKTDGVLTPATNFLEPLDMLIELHVSRVVLPPIPRTVRLQKINLSNGISKDALGNCLDLRNLEITSWELLTDNKAWLAECNHLSELNLDHVTPYTIERLLGRASSLKTLRINNCNLDCINKKSCTVLLTDLKNLESLDLSNNGITDIPLPTFRSLGSLEQLNLSYNKLSEGMLLIPSLISLQNLRTLKLSQNPFNDSICEFFLFENIVSHWPTNIEHLYLSDVGATKLCIQEIVQQANIVHLDLSHNNIEALELQYVKSEKYGMMHTNHKLPLTVDLRHNPVRKFVLEKNQYNELNRLQEKTNVTIIVDATVIECDCEHVWLARALREIPQLSIQGLGCTRGPIQNIPLDSLECDGSNCSPGCQCRRWWSNHTIDASCTDLQSMPNISDLRRLQAPKCYLKTLLATDLQRSLIYLDLSDNLLSYVAADAAAALFDDTVPSRVVRLAGNPLACTCDNYALLSTLQQHQDQVEDYDNVTVACDNITAISELVVTDLCIEEYQKQLKIIALGTCGVLVITALATLALYQRYHRELRIFLYNRGWCQCLFKEEDFDDRPYDVFIAFSHGDEELVVNEIVPVLESEPHPYSVCVHYRDWIPGEWIPMQIARSVQQSRRTLIIVSTHFLDSMWGMLEFRTAMMTSIRENRPRVIIVLLDEGLVRDERVDPELRAHLTNNTYLCWGDRWFWDKFRYALPHRHHLSRGGQNKTANTEYTRTSTYNTLETQASLEPTQDGIPLIRFN